jgi:nucleotide-binding universal stress UspA family protein
MRRILIGYDGSERGDDALALGRTLARAAGDPEVVVATVYPALLPADSYGRPSLREERLRHEALEALARARAAWPQLPEGAFVPLRATSPSAGLQRYAAESDVEVIVLGASHRTGLGRIFAGSATEQTLQGAPRPVAVAPPGYAADHREGATLTRIGIGYDGSPESRHALELAASLAVAAGATVELIDVVHAEGLPLTEAYGYGSFIEAAREQAERELAGGRALLERHGVERVACERPEGVPSRELIAAGERLDLLVLGSRGHGPALRLLLGCTSARVVREAPCPVLVLPRSAAPERSGDPLDAAASASD